MQCANYFIVNLFEASTRYKSEYYYLIWAYGAIGERN